MTSKRRGGNHSTGGSSGNHGSHSNSFGRESNVRSKSTSSVGGSKGNKDKHNREDRIKDKGRSTANSTNRSRGHLPVRNRSTQEGTTASNKRKRVIDPTLLARGMSGRSIGARVANHIKIVSHEDTERDLRHMKAYSAACIAYAQKLYVFHNRLPECNNQSNGSNTNAPISMPVRIDPEEEKRIALLRMRIAASEAQREILETEYTSLRAHYVHTSKKLLKTRNAVDKQLIFLRNLVQRRGHVLALRRVRCAMAHDVLKGLQTQSYGPNQHGDIVEVWNSIEQELMDAERVCLGPTKKKMRSEGAFGWDSQHVPRMPYGVPIFLSPLSSVADRAAGFSLAGLFDTHPKDITWLEPNLPKQRQKEEIDLQKLLQEEELLRQELRAENETNDDLQKGVIQAKERSDGMCAMMSLLRTETEAVLWRHNLILDSPEAQARTTTLDADEEVHEDDDVDDDDEASLSAVQPHQQQQQQQQPHVVVEFAQGE